MYSKVTQAFSDLIFRLYRLDTQAFVLAAESAVLNHRDLAKAGLSRIALSALRTLWRAVRVCLIVHISTAWVSGVKILAVNTFPSVLTHYPRDLLLLPTIISKHSIS